MIPPKQEKASMPKSQSLPLAALLLSRWNKQNFYLKKKKTNMLRIFPYYVRSKHETQRKCLESSLHMIYWHDFYPSSLCTFDLLNVWWWSLQVIHHHHPLQPHLTRASPNIRVIAADLRRMERIYKFSPGGTNTNRLPCLQRGRWRQTRAGAQGDKEVQGGNTRRPRENSNSAAVATNRRSLINRDVVRGMRVQVVGLGGGCLTFGLTAAG